MSTRTYHGEIRTEDVASALVARFDKGDLQVQSFGDPGKLSVQIATRRNRQAGGETCLTVTLQAVEDGVLVQMGRQNWSGVAASLGKTVLSMARNPWSILERIDDVAADLDVFQLEKQAWETIDRFAAGIRASLQVSERLRTLQCPYCDHGNPVGAGACGHCGGPLADVQPQACSHCGFVNEQGAVQCGSCRGQLGAGAPPPPPMPAAVAQDASESEPQPSTPMVSCRGCGAPHAKGTLFCSVCSRPLPRR